MGNVTSYCCTCLYALCSHICVFLPYVDIPVVEGFTGLMGCGSLLGEFPMDMLDSEMVVNDEETRCEFED